MSYLYTKQPLREGYNRIVSPGNSPLKWLEFGRLILNPGNIWQVETGGNEVAMSIFRGAASARVDTAEGERVTFAEWSRDDPFSEPAAWVYAPRNASLIISADSAVDIGIFQATARTDGTPRIIAPSDVEVRRIGGDGWRRTVSVVPQNAIMADRLVVGETVADEGNWSSYPPHKHDTLGGASEIPQQEVYFFMVSPRQGFGIQMVYTKAGEDPDGGSPIRESYIVRDGDTVVIPKGYHPVVAAGGCKLFYFWALTGEVCGYGRSTQDPDFQWLSAQHAASTGVHTA